MNVSVYICTITYKYYMCLKYDEVSEITESVHYLYLYDNI